MSEIITLPKPILDGAMSLEQAMQTRRSVRSFQADLLSESQKSQLLWAAQGITNSRGYRSAPSAGALFPLEVYWIEHVGLYHYDPSQHALKLEKKGDLRATLCRAALDQEMILQAPSTMVIAAVYSRTQAKYGESRGARYVLIDLGHAAQNVLLQATALGLGAVTIGAFEDRDVQAVLDLPPSHAPLYLIPIGYPG